MVNRAKKGNEKERKIRKELSDDGWRIVYKSVRTAYGAYDFGGGGGEHGLFDVVAYKNQDRKYISSKHFGQGNYYLGHQREIKEFAEKYGKPGESYELWLWVSPRWQGGGKNKKWNKGEYLKLVL